MNFICIFLSLPFLSFSQIKIRNISLSNPDKKIFYNRLTNLLDIKGFDSTKNIRLISLNGNFETKIENGKKKYEFSPNNICIDTIFIYLDNIFHSKQVYEIREIEEQKIRLGNIKSNYSTVDDILKNNKLTIISDSTFLKNTYDIFSFVLFKIHKLDTIPIYRPFKKGDSSYIHVVDIQSKNSYDQKFELKKPEEINWGNKLDEYQLKEIKKMKKGDKLLFTMIKGGCSNCYFKRFPDFQLQIK